ncbi:conserved exported hypothetical protein [uncultured delta proteobacterium]|uniref:CDP-glycerol:poly(Glycerophosphate) glycerophosphotransferase n=1 Tax=uncultured delta proteobacterium TaxID=34034 RepID=A0A212IXI1_9DELT|nr:conserved exported hypothetical protein [uncultured delta proteobacterium]
MMRRLFSRKSPAGAAMLALFAGVLLVPLFPGVAHAYLDPGTGSMLLSALIGIAATVFFMVKTFYYKAAGIFYRLTGTAVPASGKNGIVFYSEGRQYWNTFRPVLEALDAKGESAAYLTSGEDDPGLSHPFTHVSARYIGSGNRAFAAMNMLEAGVCVMTTPGLDVLQIRRSPGVGHYAHLVHSPTDAALYKLYSFDWFDSVLCSGEHQIRSLRFLEQLRGTRAKELFRTGCPYMDVLADELAALPPSVTPSMEPGARLSAQGASAAPRVLLAPTWGRNGLLRRFGLDLLLPMADAGFSLTIRPHPQSRTAEPELLGDIALALAAYPNVAWDHGSSSLAAMVDSDVLVSDFSGIVFDYAFILERPVVTIAMDMDTRGMDAGDLAYPAWELDVLPELGASIAAENIRNLPETIRNLPPRAEFAARMRELRAKSLFNYRSSGAVAAEQILAVRQGLAGK